MSACSASYARRWKCLDPYAMLLSLGDFELEAGEEYEEQERAPDPQEEDALAALRTIFKENPNRVFFGRQLAVQQEKRWFHWITHRALARLEEEGFIKGEVRPLTNSDAVHLMWHRSYRYPRRQADRVVEIIESYSHPRIARAIGGQGEWLVLEGFMRRHFVLVERAANSYRGRTWTQSNHNLDFVIERDGVAYGVEVKNTLAYMDYDELREKTKMCLWLGLRPIFAARMLPKTWANEVIKAGGYAMILKYQLYPRLADDLAQSVKTELGLPVDTPEALYDGTMDRFERWHTRHLP